LQGLLSKRSPYVNHLRASSKGLKIHPSFDPTSVVVGEAFLPLAGCVVPIRPTNLNLGITNTYENRNHPIPKIRMKSTCTVVVVSYLIVGASSSSWRDGVGNTDEAPPVGFVRRAPFPVSLPHCWSLMVQMSLLTVSSEHLGGKAFVFSRAHAYSPKVNVKYEWWPNTDRNRRLLSLEKLRTRREKSELYMSDRRDAIVNREVYDL